MADQLKNIYNKKFISDLSISFKSNYPKFDEEKFKSLIFNSAWKDKELKERMSHISSSIREVLPNDYEKAVKIILKTAPKFGGFEAMFFPDFIEKYGAEKKNHKVSLMALEELTKFSSSEFAIRPFIVMNTSSVMKLMMKWSKSENYHVRRLASEGCRPRLPWAMSLPEFKKDPNLIIPILEKLKNDPEDYVRRSVANNLNDISKDHPELVLKIAKKWLGKTKNTDWIVKHALRTLLKAGNETAMKLFGFMEPKTVKVLTVGPKKNKMKIGDDGYFHFEFKMKGNGKVRLEYAIDYLKKNGSHNRKVFKITENTYSKGEYQIQKKHSFKQMSTRKHYPGEHYVSFIVNGKEMKRVSFVLV